MIMKFRNYIIPLLLAAFALGGCSDDTFVSTGQQTGELDESDLIEASLSLSVNDFIVSTYTRTEEPSGDTETASEWENWIDNVWVFQYDESGDLLIYPRYYTLTNQSQLTNLKVVLKPVTSRIYVVTNVNHSDWAKSYTNFNTVNSLLESKLAEPEPLFDLTDDSVEGHIPMQGYSESVDVYDKITIEVPVERMYAKVKLRVIFDRDIDFHEPFVSNVEFGNIPWYCRIGTLYDGTDRSQDSKYPTGDTYDWIERDIAQANNTDDPNEKLRSADEVTYDYVIYLPENIQGEVENSDHDAKADVAPSHATWVGADIEYTNSEGVDSHKTFTVYPGGNQYNNYNIRRNQVYRVTLNIGEFEEEYTPSANCIVVAAGKKASFLPYYRVEDGGGYSFSDYLDPDDPTKCINGLKIIWQTENCIGNNSAGDLVYFVPSNPQTIYDKIYVTANADGNALIAAYNDEACEGDILWSWHIWVSSEDPANVGNAITYYTYDWDETGVYGESSGRARIPGYGVMPCNIGATLSSAVGTTPNADKVKTFGMAYQWGRKDPFPPAWEAGRATANKGDNANAEYFRYTEVSVQQLYDNSHNYITGMTGDTDEDKLFHSVSGTTIESQGLGMDFAIKNPTVFMCGTYDATTDIVDSDECLSYVRTMDSYHNHGDWMATGLSDDRLWGSVGQENATKSMVIGYDNSGDTRHLYDDYGTKSIFDPCPYGWRISPPDQWLGFTSTGQNPTTMDEVNYNDYYDTDGYSVYIGAGYGMYMYMQEFRRGLTSYFPVQGMRAPNGASSKVRVCGNYHNATTDESNIVNILHIHNSIANFKLFEFNFVDYYVKSTGGPVRCVRDSH